MASANNPLSPIFYVYVIFRRNGIPCYIGKGCGRRWASHFTNATNEELRNLIGESGGSLPVALIRERLTEEDALSVERTLVKILGRTNIGTGPLFNLTDAGEGLGANPSPSTRAKMSAAKKGVVFTEEHKNKISISCKNFGERGRPITNGTVTRRLKDGEQLPDGWFFGHSDNFSSKVSEGMKKSGFRPKGAPKGKIWITNNQQESMIFPTEQLPDGWQRGRLASSMWRGKK